MKYLMLWKKIFAVYPCLTLSYIIEEKNNLTWVIILKDTHKPKTPSNKTKAKR